MKCSECGFGNPPEMRFCGGCGSALAPPCPGCGQPAGSHRPSCPKPDAIADDERASTGRPPESLGPGDAEGERRQLTVMFCDLVGSTALSERLDAEVLRDVLVAYQAVAARAVQEFDGTIAQYLGDGVLVYFGFPVAHEDDPLRAIGAARLLVDSMEDLNDRLAVEVGVRLGVHIGIHTGPVVVGQIGAQGHFELAAIGETVNVAARLSDFSEGEAIVISETTRRLVGGFFEMQPLGELSIRGLSHPVAAHCVLRPTGAASRLEAARFSGLTPFVGRQRELEILRETWARVRSGDGRVVLLSGEPGIGKSRLLHVLREHLAAEPHRWLEGRCTPLSSNSAFYPVVDVLRSIVGLESADPPDARLDRLERAVNAYGLPPEAVALFAALLSIPTGDRHPLPPMTPLRMRQQTLEALRILLARIARSGPVVLLVEDLHWVDPSTLEFLTSLVQGPVPAHLLIVLAFRPEFDPPWKPERELTALTLGRLARSDVERLMNAVAGSGRLPPEVARSLVDRVDGVPLFAEEMTKSVLESEAIDSLKPEIPATLNDSLMARLDRLGDAKAVAQVAATLGRSFSLELLAAVSDLAEAKLHASLARLVVAGLVDREGSEPSPSYVFKHALVQDAAYQSLLHRRRRRYHGRAAEVLCASFPETAETRPELVAHHYTEASRPDDAIPFWLRAGQMAFARSAKEEAIAHLHRGIGLVPGLGDAEASVRVEVGLQTTLGAVLAVANGYATPEVARAFARARKLAEHLGDVPDVFPILRGLSQFHEVRGEYRVARTLGEQMVRLAAKTGIPGFDLEASSLYGQAHFWTGDMAKAYELVGHAVEIYAPEEHHTHAQLFGEDPGVRAHSYLGWILWLMGFPDRGLAHNLEAVRLAEAAPHPFTRCLAHNFAAAQHQLRCEPQAALQRAEVAIEVAVEQGFPFWEAMGRMYRGWARAHSGEPEDGVREVEAAIDTWCGIGCRLGRPNIYGLLADARSRRGDRQGAVEALETALALMEETGERFLESDQIRRLALLCHACGAPQDHVVAELRRALQMARERGQRSLELRAATSLVDVATGGPERDEAAALLADVFASFAEGFETADLREASAVLARCTA